MKIKNVLYMALMIIFIVLAYLFLDRGLNVRTKVYVTYQEKSSVTYKVYLLDNDIYQNKYLNMNERYITNLVDYIDVDIDYQELFNHSLSGYYTYQVINTLVGYSDDINDSVFKKEEKIDNKTEVLNQNNLSEITLSNNIKIDYHKYLLELKDYNNRYQTNLSGYLETRILVKENLDFFNKGNIQESEKEIKLLMPLSYETFKIDVKNDHNQIGSYNDFSKREKVNYIFLLIGILCALAAGFFLVMTIRNMINESKDERNYRRELKRILDSNGDILVKVNKINAKQKYNLIWVASFGELKDAYRRIENPISYKETKKNAETIFLMLDEESAWIYRLGKDK